VPDLYTALGWIGRRVDDDQGARIGTVDDVFVDLGTPRWLVVRGGGLRRPELAVPVERVAEDDDGRLIVGRRVVWRTQDEGRLTGRPS
jgi:hypothetical protein